MKLSKTLVFYEDAGHGWLEVPLHELFDLDLIDKITAFSYIDHNHAFLEQDLDMAYYLDARKTRAGDDFEMRRLYHETSPVRNNYAYTPERLRRSLTNRELPRLF